MSEKVYFLLKEDQRKLLTLLFSQVHEAFIAGEKGIVLSQLKENAYSVATFIPHEYAKRIREIIKEMEERP